MVRNAQHRRKRTDMAPVIRAPGIPPTPENTPAPIYDDAPEPDHAPLSVPEALKTVEPVTEAD